MSNRTKPLSKGMLLACCIGAAIVIAIGYDFGSRLIIRPDYDILFCKNRGNSRYTCKGLYVITPENRLGISKEVTSPEEFGGSLYYYDSDKDSSREITLDEAKELVIVTEQPKGYILKSRTIEHGWHTGYKVDEIWSIKRTVFSKPFRFEMTRQISVDNNKGLSSSLGWVVPTAD